MKSTVFVQNFVKFALFFCFTVGDSGSAEEATPVIISTIFISRFQQEVGDPPGELVITPIATPIGTLIHTEFSVHTRYYKLGAKKRKYLSII